MLVLSSHAPIHHSCLYVFVISGEEQFSLHEVTKPEGVDPEMLEPPLNEDDDLADDLDDIDQTEGDSKTENLVLAQFEKVSLHKV